MTKEVFMNRLSELLADMPQAERDEALSYYEDYISDAGEENEESVMESLGTPEKVAETIKMELGGNGDSGEYSESGYSNGTNPKDEVVVATAEGEKVKKKMTASMVILLVILGVFALPILGPILVAVLSVVFAVFCVIAAVIFAVLVLGIALVIAGAVAVVAGIATMLSNLLAGGIAIGVGLLLFGIGLFITWLGVWIVAKATPPLTRGFVNLCRKPFVKKGV